MKKITIFFMFGIFVVGVVIGILGATFVMKKELNEVPVPQTEHETQETPSVDFVEEKPIVFDPNGSKGLFGVDSQRMLNHSDNFGPSRSKFRYQIGIVSDIDLEKDDDGSWYIKSCSLPGSSMTRIFFASPYPLQNDLMKGDFFGFTGELTYSDAGVELGIERFYFINPLRCLRIYLRNRLTMKLMV